MGTNTEGSSVDLVIKDVFNVDTGSCPDRKGKESEI